MSDDNIPGRLGDLAEALVKMEPREILARAMAEHNEPGLWERFEGLEFNDPWFEAYRNEADAILSALSENGYKVLGREPSEGMSNTGHLVALSIDDETLIAQQRADDIKTWRAMWDKA